MNCANHPANAAIAYCRTCGKPLCASCTRDVKGVIYCENCLAERLAGVQPVTGQPLSPVIPTTMPVAPSTGPNPAVAGILAGFFPFGVGAVYTGQYAKGLAHLLIFVGLIIGMGQHEPISTVCAFGFAFFYVWQIIDAVRTAKALQLGQPAPDPLGLGQAFSTGGKVETSKIPIGAVVLIGLGALFLLQNLGVFEFSIGHVGPVCLILLGAWMFARRAGLLSGDSRQLVRGQPPNFVGAAVLVTLGILWLVDNVRGLSFFGWVGALLLVIGLVKILQRDQKLPPGPSSGPTGTTEPQPPVSEVRNG
jgi:Domain of unknown function (DUF5668)/B-box zinc finger